MELTTTARAGRVVGNDYCAAFKGALLHVQAGVGVGALAFHPRGAYLEPSTPAAEATGGFSNNAEWNTCSVHMAGGCMCKCVCASGQCNV